MPFDTRELFDERLLREMVLQVFLEYYRGFVGDTYGHKLPLDIHHLTERMIREMGVDKHMEETVRVADQKEMTDAAFRAFLLERGYTEEALIQCNRGEQDLVIHTGPHLGAFNDVISLPELIEAVGAVSALCISGRHWKQKTKGQITSGMGSVLAGR